MSGVGPLWPAAIKGADMINLRVAAVPALMLVGATLLAGCGDKEPASNPTPSESAMMGDDDMMSTSPTPAMSDDSMSDDSMSDDSMMDDTMTPDPAMSDDSMSDG
jgi:hypothetical protein